MNDTLTAALAGSAGLVGPDVDRRCRTGQILDTVSAENRATILAHLYGATIDADLALMLRNGGIDVGASTLSKHRVGTCVCDVRPDDEPKGRTR